MHRRHVLVALAAPPLLAVRPLAAHHGWQPDRSAPPLYLEGIVSTITWAEPHPAMELQLSGARRVPEDLARRPSAKPHRDPRPAELLRRAVLPETRGGRWRVYLPALARLSVWEMPRPKVGDTLAVIGHAGPRAKDDPALEAELIFIDGRLYPLSAEPERGAGSGRSG